MQLSADQTSTTEGGSTHVNEIRFFSLLVLAFQFGLFLIALYKYDLESRAFLHLGIVAFFGFLIHYFLPFRWRRPFFAVVSVICLATVFGLQLEQLSLPGLAQAGWILGLGGILIGLCHLPIPFAYRVLLVLGAGIALSLLRGGIAWVPWSAAIWPIFGSMFMFRTAVYLYALRYEKTPITAVDSICYFFMLPNPCFPLFPVVDFQTFRQTYYDASDRHQIYQTGALWLFRGTTHLILYRFVYQYLVIDASAVTTIPQLVQYLVWPFLLYLRVSGQFHIIVGLLHFFGFNLPETHRLYYLSSSFTDFWRRINIYWKDFMMKLVFYPSYFRTRRWGDTTALVLSTALVFFATWILHGYQWYWIRGSWEFTWNDALFWSILALLVIVNALYEVKHGRRRSFGVVKVSWRDAMKVALKTIGVFCTICVLWSFWSAPSISQWSSAFDVLSRFPTGEPVAGIAILLCIVAAIGALAALLLFRNPQHEINFARCATSVIAGFFVMIGLQTTVALELMNPTARGVVASLSKSELNRKDFEAMERGYYENLLDVSRFNPELQEVYRTRPKDWTEGLAGKEFMQLDEPPFFALRPLFEGRDRGATVRTNSSGLRDKEYAVDRPEGVRRIAMVGSSFVMGVGVENDQTFEALLEDQLNETSADESVRYEVLNFGVAGYTQMQIMSAVERRVFEFSPDVVCYVEHGDPFMNTMQGVVNHVLSGQAEHFDFLVEIAIKAGVRGEKDRVVIKNALAPFESEILLQIYRRMVEACKSHGAPAVWVYLPRPEEFDNGPSDVELEIAQRAGFQTLILKNVYPKEELSSLWLARWDHHPNAAGHRMIAQRLFEAIQAGDPIDLSALDREESLE
jgi:hypothetical protein